MIKKINDSSFYYSIFILVISIILSSCSWNSKDMKYSKCSSQVDNTKFRKKEAYANNLNLVLPCNSIVFLKN